MHIRNVRGLLVTLGIFLCLSGFGLSQRPAAAGAATNHKPRIVIAAGLTLPEPRAHHTATPLVDGRILLVGGSKAPDEHLGDVAIFDPATRTLTAVAPLHTGRHDHTATLLKDGRVLVVGGYTLPQQWLADAEVYDPATNVWTVIPPLSEHGVGHTATLLKDGRVLVVGGCIGSGVCTNQVEIFTPRTDTWSAAAPLGAERGSHVAVLLHNRRVLVAGGFGSQGAPADGAALLYDPRRDSWVPTGPMIKPGINSQAALLRDGRVLVAGGIAWDDQLAQQITASAEIYNPATNRWRSAAALIHARYAFVMATLPDGKVLAVGGTQANTQQWTDDLFVRAIEAYDPQADHWYAVGELAQPRAHAAVARLSDNRLWVTGGRAGYAGATFWADTVLIDACRARRCP